MKTIRDVSFAGATVYIDNHKLEDFMDDANPVEFPDTEVSTVGVNCNGNMIRNAKPNVVMMSVTVIPCTDDDKFLYDLSDLFQCFSFLCFCCGHVFALHFLSYNLVYIPVTSVKSSCNWKQGQDAGSHLYVCIRQR